MSDRPADAERLDGKSMSDDSSRLRALCDRVRQLAEAAGDESLRALSAKSQQLVADRRARAEAESRHELERAETRLHKAADRELQNARLELRSRLTAFQWSQLTAVLDEAVQTATRIRERDPGRYVAALVRWFNTARAQLPPGRVVVQANAEDLRLLREASGAEAVDWVEADLPDGFVVSTPNGNIVCDQTMARRRSRLEDELRLVAADILFTDNPERAGGVEAG